MRMYVRPESYESQRRECGEPLKQQERERYVTAQIISPKMVPTFRQKMARSEVLLVLHLVLQLVRGAPGPIPSATLTPDAATADAAVLPKVFIVPLPAEFNTELLDCSAFARRPASFLEGGSYNFRNWRRGRSESSGAYFQHDAPRVGAVRLYDVT